MTLIFNVQADQVEAYDDTSKIWLALKISAVHDTPSNPVGQADIDALLPWKWLKFGSADAWNPYDPLAWTIWRTDSTSPVEVAAEALYIDPVEVPLLFGRLDTAVTAIAGTAPAVRPEALRIPHKDDPIDLRGTVPGFVERLAIAPHPLPSATRCHGIVALDLATLGGADPQQVTFIAAPRLRTGATDRAPDSVLPVRDGQTGIWNIIYPAPGTQASMHPCLARNEMTANAATGRILDTYALSVADAGHVTPELTSEMVAALPQALADALDPVARLRSVLQKTLKAWLKDPTKLDSLKGDLEGSATLVKALDFIVVQVLAVRLDAVGRFEVPLVDAFLNDEKPSDATCNLLYHHLNEASAASTTDKIPAAIRLSADQIDHLTLKSLFAAGHLRHLAGLSETVSPDAMISDSDYMRHFWLNPKTSAPTPGPYLYRQLELTDSPVPPADPAAYDILLKVTDRPLTGLGDIPKPADPALPTSLNFDTLRASAAMAYAAPFIEGLVCGRTQWNDRAQQGQASKPFSELLSEAMQALLSPDSAGRPTGLYDSLFDAAGRIAPIFTSLLGDLKAAAVQEAVAIAKRIGRTVSPNDRVTPAPLPLTFRLDQLRTFPQSEDAWSRLAGYCLLAARTPTADTRDASYYSLNRATLHLGKETTKPQDTAVLWRGVATDSWQQQALVDPMASAPGDMIGVSDVVAEFRNAWQTAPMTGQADLNGPAVGVPESRIYSGAPDNEKNKVPALSFGYHYTLMCLPVGMGGVLPRDLRVAAAHPYEFADRLTSNRFRKTQRYLRTVGVGTPVVSHDARKIDDVLLLAEELPLRRSPQRLPYQRITGTGGWTRRLRFNHDSETGLARVNWSGGEAGLVLEVVLHGTGSASLKVVSDSASTLPYPLPVQNSLRVRVWIYRTGKFEIKTQPDFDTGDSPESSKWDVAATAQLPQNDSWGPHGAWLEIGEEQAQLRVETCRAQVFGETESDELIDNTPSGDAPRREAVILLDGLPAPHSNGRASTTVHLTLKGPTVDRHTWERWVNSALFTPTASLREPVAKKLNRLHGLSAEAAKNEALPDPAVGALHVELWQVFPHRQQIDSGYLLGRPGSLEPISERLSIAIATGSNGNRPEASFDGATARLRPGCVYELRSRAAIRPDAKPFDGLMENQDRFGDGVLATFSEAEIITGDRVGRWLLGPAHVQPIEVATNAAVQVVASHWPEKMLRLAVPGKDATEIEFAQVEGSDSRRFILGFPADLFKAGADINLRYYTRATLVPRKWYWRGRPVLPGPVPGQGRKDLFDRAFDERRDSDVGREVSGRLHARHAAGTLKPDAPEILRYDPQWKGGRNLLQGQVRLTHRYGPLMDSRSQPDLVLKIADKEAWIDREIPDVGIMRDVAKPPVALVLPLTEAMDDSQIPPLLVLFSGSMFDLDNVNDGIALAMEVARHPLPFVSRLEQADDQIAGLDAEIAKLDSNIAAASPADKPALEARLAACKKTREDCVKFRQELEGMEGLGSPELQALKYLPETGPDAIRTGEPHTGAMVPLRMDGPIGYGFDKGFEAVNYRHTGFLVTPTGDNLAPWSQIKLKFRRLETFLRGISPDKPQNDGGYTISSAGQAGTHSIRHEGVGAQFKLTAGDAAKDMTIALGPVGAQGHYVRLTCSPEGNNVKLQASVLKQGGKAPELPNAGTATLAANGKTVHVRLIVAAGPKPEVGDTWTPTAEVLVQAWVGGAPRPDEPAVPGDSAWLSLFALPLEAGAPTAIANDARVWFGGAPEVQAVRLSPYAPPLWCQFTVAGSVFHDKDTPVHVSKLIFKGKSWSELKLHYREKPDIGAVLLSDPVDKSNKTPSGSDVETVILAVFTARETDIFGRPGDTPVLVAQLVANGNSLAPKPLWTREGTDRWPDNPKGTYRLRLMRCLKRAGRELTALSDLFEEDITFNPSMNPRDAKGMLMSISVPVDQVFD